MPNDNQPCKSEDIIKEQSPVPSSTNSLLYKFLLSLSYLQQRNPCRKTFSICELERFMRSHFCLDGDVCSQIKTTAELAVYHGYAHANPTKRYSIIYPMSTVQQTRPGTEARTSEIEYARCVFRSGKPRALGRESRSKRRNKELTDSKSECNKKLKVCECGEGNEEQTAKELIDVTSEEFSRMLDSLAERICNDKKEKSCDREKDCPDDYKRKLRKRPTRNK